MLHAHPTLRRIFTSLISHRRDTVCSVGIIPRRLPFVGSNTAIRTFRHALSLDERRAKFKANHYHHTGAIVDALRHNAQEVVGSAENDTAAVIGAAMALEPIANAEVDGEKNVGTKVGAMAELWSGTSFPFAHKLVRGQTEEEHAFDQTTLVDWRTDVKEVWFAGCHCGAYLLRASHVEYGLTCECTRVSSRPFVLRFQISSLTHIQT